MTLGEQGLDQRLHLRNVPGGSWLIVGTQNSESAILVIERDFVLIREGPPVSTLRSGLFEHLVVDVGYIAYQRHAVTLVS